MVMYLLMTAAFVLGGILLGVGLYLTRQDEFPSWWRTWMLWPLVEVTPRVTHIQGWAGAALGVSILAIGFTPVVPEVLGGVLVLVAMVGYLAGAVLFVYSTYLSRRFPRLRLFPVGVNSPFRPRRRRFKLRPDRARPTTDAPLVDLDCMQRRARSG